MPEQLYYVMYGQASVVVLALIAVGVFWLAGR